MKLENDYELIEVFSLFNEHKIVSENGKSVLYLFTQSFDANLTLIKGIFQHLHNDVLLDWVDDYLDLYDINFLGDLIRIVAESTIVRDLDFPFYMRRAMPTPVANRKILEFRQVVKKH